MVLNWTEYLTRFRFLLAHNFIVVKRQSDSRYFWVDLEEEPPQRRTFREAWEYVTNEHYFDSSLFPFVSNSARGISGHFRRTS